MPEPMLTSPAIRLLDWSTLFSPIAETTEHALAWSHLGLAGTFDENTRKAYNSTFLISMPQPQVPLLFSSLLQREASACREDWMRVAAHLGLSREGASLPPDHIALACELLAHAWNRNERVLLEGAVERYFLPWLELAMERCDSSLKERLLAEFQQDITTLLSAPAQAN
ncbi:hypothetical protein HDN1F_20120 [gamma proteobacterium HdN1]|nr:hypothetical protein HDN1F_20120 [gamma proteobacterium HdN1]